MKKLITSALCTIILLAGCAGKPSTVEEAYKKTEYSIDEYSRTSIVKGPYVSISFGIDGGGGVMLRKMNNEYQLYFSTFSQLGWCFFETAFDKNIGQLPFQQVRTRVGSGGITHEDFYLTITNQQILMMSDYGIDVKIYGKNRTIIVDLPPVYVQGFLKKANEHI